jgi:hypothetical protein
MTYSCATTFAAFRAGGTSFDDTPRLEVRMITMATKSAWLTFAAVTLGLAGCGKSLPPENSTSVRIDGPTGGIGSDASRLTQVIDLEELRKLPRAELAQRCVDLETTIRRQEQFHREGKLTYTLLPHAQLPMVLPIFRDATFLPERGVTLPPYLKPDAHDGAVAIHVARYGDVEGAKRIAPPNDAAIDQRIRDAAGSKDYPLEWTRLVALILHSNQIALAIDNKDGAKNLIAVHRQLRTVLDDTAKSGPLGVALLGRGLGTLKQAAAAWKAAHREDLVQTINDSLREFGELPRYAVDIPASFESLDKLFAVKPGPNAVIAVSPARVADLLNLFVPTTEADTCVAFPTADGKTSEILFTYRPLLFGFNQPQQFVEPIEELTAGESSDAGDCPSRVWKVGDAKLDVTLTNRHPTLGGLVRLYRPGTERTVELPRDFGPVHLDRSFEQNRRLTTWPKRGDTLLLVGPAAAALGNPVPTRTVAGAILQREPKHDLISTVTFEFAENPNDSLPAAGTIARPLFESAGQPHFAFGPVGVGSIDLVWSNGKTTYKLGFPYAREKAVHLTATDAKNAELAVRVAASVEKDRQDRLQRIAAQNALSIVPRQLDGIRLGMTRAEFQKALPKSPQLFERDIPGGVMAAYVGPAAGGDAVAREWFARFDGDKLAEVRVRYTDAPGIKAGSFARKIESLKAKLGEPEITAGTNAWWSDLPKRGNPVTYSWHDDVTLLTAQHEPHGIEVVLRDCPPDHPAGTPLPAIEYLGRGTAQVKLGMAKDELVKLGGQSVDGGGFLVDPAKDDPFSGILAWVENGKVTRIVARHKVNLPGKGDQQASKLLLDQWSRDSRTVGWPNRQDAAGPHLQSLASRDDRTRYRLFWADDQGRTGVFSEWKDAR